MAKRAAERRLRLGMVGGGVGSFIGEAHRIAARMDDRYELVAGVLGSTPDSAARSGREIGLDPERSYGTFEEMAKAEAGREDGIEVVAVLTPNNSHHPICKTFLEADIDVICDKPLTTSVAEARDLVQATRQSGRFLGVTYNYCGYAMMREARAVVAAGTLGEIRVVQAEFVSGWLATALEAEGNKQAAWRTDPALSGPTLVVGDLGTHAFHLGEYVAGRRVTALAADLSTFVAGRALEDNAQISLRYDNGARGALWTSVVAAGENAGLRLRVYGEKGHLAWDQGAPNKLTLALDGESPRLVGPGEGASAAARRASRSFPGLPEGFHEAFATLYTDFADVIAARRAGTEPDPLALWSPDVEDGARGVAFVAAVLESHRQGGAWTDFESLF